MAFQERVQVLLIMACLVRYSRVFRMMWEVSIELLISVFKEMARFLLKINLYNIIGIKLTEFHRQNCFPDTIVWRNYKHQK